MKWTGLYFLGYVVLLGGLIAALWKLGMLQQLGTAWTVIGIVVAIGLGIMVAVSAGGGEKKTIEIDHG